LHTSPSFQVRLKKTHHPSADTLLADLKKKIRKMRRFLLTIITLCTMAIPPSADAARNESPLHEATHTLRLVVLIASGCVYCAQFRKDIEPSYKKSPHNSQIPLIYIDINDEAAEDLALKGPIQVVPTVVLMDGNRELSRISGYIGPFNFFKVFKHMLAKR